MSFTKPDGKTSSAPTHNSARSTREMNAAAAALTLTQHEANSAVARALTSVFGFGKPAARELSEVAGCSERTALTWINGEASPSFVYTLRLLTTVPQFAAEVRELCGHRSDIDPELQRDLLAFAAVIQRRAGVAR